MTVNILPFVVIDEYADNIDVIKALIDDRNGGVVQTSNIIDGTYIPLETYPDNYHNVAFHRVWLIASRMLPDGKKPLSHYLLHLGYKVNGHINNLVRTQIEIKCVKDNNQWFRMCYRFELKFDTHTVEGNLTKMAFEKALLEFQEEKDPTDTVAS